MLVFVNNFGYWNTSQTGISDADLEAGTPGGWKKAGTVRGSTKGVISFNLKSPVKTEKIRLVVRDTNDHQFAAVMELQAGAARRLPARRPTRFETLSRDFHPDTRNPSMKNMLAIMLFGLAALLSLAPATAPAARRPTTGPTRTTSSSIGC